MTSSSSVGGAGAHRRSSLAKQKDVENKDGLYGAGLLRCRACECASFGCVPPVKGTGRLSKEKPSAEACGAAATIAGWPPINCENRVSLGHSSACHFVKTIFKRLVGARDGRENTKESGSDGVSSRKAVRREM